MTSEDPTIPKTLDKDKDKARESPTLPADTSEEVTTESDPKDSKKKEANITKEHKT
jgi:hypothetical protein